MQREVRCRDDWLEDVFSAIITTMSFLSHLNSHWCSNRNRKDLAQWIKKCHNEATSRLLLRVHWAIIQSNDRFLEKKVGFVIAIASFMEPWQSSYSTFILMSSSFPLSLRVSILSAWRVSSSFSAVLSSQLVDDSSSFPIADCYCSRGRTEDFWTPMYQVEGMLDV